MSMQSEVKYLTGFHPITCKLISKMESGKPGDQLSDSDLTEIAGIPIGVNEKGYSYLLSAIRHLEKAGVVWQRIRDGQKIICLNPLEKVERTGSDIRRIRKITHRSARIIGSISPDELPKDKRVYASAMSAQLGAIALMSKTESTKKLAGNTQSVPQIGDAFKLFDR